ncbi:hypothetical protein BJI67_15735 (plasmid) [Acidihalobacter aeolianus]|uniref:Uncharacterized protein n=1 Tax=Acidihalobacter aeolianus TaxID=2792603 RepID=A0A1D8KCK9_9GAMM|nr:hypothetical protein BJI67_15735 [Acidihalobacter aeolianus]
MMVCNDLSLSNQSLGEWKKERPSWLTARKIGAGMYFLRIQLAHLKEGFKVIEEIKNDPQLSTLITRCDDRTQQSFWELVQFLPNAPKSKEFEQIIGRVRHNLAFHYDESGKMIKMALADRAGRPDARYSSITRGSTAHLWYFKVADDIIDSIVVRQIWNIPRNKNLRVEADHMSDRVHQIFIWFMDFSGEFIWKYCEG